jgi:hypothetical protein
MKYRIGEIIKPNKLNWLNEDKIKEYLKSQGWETLTNVVINGFIWTQYLNEYDYKNVYLKDTENSKEEIIKHVIDRK